VLVGVAACELVTLIGADRQPVGADDHLVELAMELSRAHGEE